MRWSERRWGATLSRAWDRRTSFSEALRLSSPVALTMSYLFEQSDYLHAVYILEALRCRKEADCFSLLVAARAPFHRGLWQGTRRAIRFIYSSYISMIIKSSCITFLSAESSFPKRLWYRLILFLFSFKILHGLDISFQRRRKMFMDLNRLIESMKMKRRYSLSQKETFY